MASMFVFSPSSSLACYQHYGSRISYCPSQKFPLLKLSDIALYSNGPSLSVKAQVTSVSETVQTELPATSETLKSSASEVEDPYHHLSPLISELAEGADVSFAMDPWLGKLALREWDVLIRRLGGVDCTTSWQIASFFKEKAPLLDKSVLWPKRMESGKAETEDSDEEENTEGRQAVPTSEAAAETTSHDVASGTNAEGDLKAGSKKVLGVLVLYKTLAKVLGRNKKFDELDKLQERVKEEGIKPNFSFFDTLFNVYTAEGFTDKVSEIVSMMETAGFTPNKFMYEKMAYMHLKKEVPDLTVAAKIMTDLKEKGLPVDLGIFKNMLKAFWRMKDVSGAEQIFQAMQAAGYTPDLKDIQKVTYCHKQTGNFERIREIMEMMTNWGTKPNVGVYDHLVNAYCKAGLLEKAKETLREYETVLGRKPTLVAFNMLVNGYGKQGRPEEALQTFHEIRKNKSMPNVVSYTSAIFALAQAGNMNKATQLYRRMVKQGVPTKLYVYLTLIRGYTKLDWTREGRKISNALRRSPIEMTEEAYGVVLALFVEGNWYNHAASVLQEVENKGKALDSVAFASLIRSFGNLVNKLTPLAKAVEGSNMELCRLLTSLFIRKSEGLNSETMSKEAVLSFIEKFTDKDEGRALIYNAFMECFWRRGSKTLARQILSSAREVYAKHTLPQLLETEWVLDVRGLSPGGAKVALTEWLSSEGEPNESKSMDGLKTVLITGDDSQLNAVQDNQVLRRALSSMLEELGSPFLQSLDNSKQLEANALEVMQWVQSDKVKKVLNFVDEPTLQ